MSEKYGFAYPGLEHENACLIQKVKRLEARIAEGETQSFMSSSHAQHFRIAVANALHVPASKLGCFSVLDHEDDVLTIVVHGGPAKGVWRAMKSGRMQRMIPDETH